MPDTESRRFRVDAVLLISILLAAFGCGPYGDGAAALRAHRREVARRTAGMAAATRQTDRGRDLAGAELEARLRDHTWVSRFQSFPGGKRGDFVQYQSFRAGGQLVVTDNYLNSHAEVTRGDTWRVDGPRLCLLWREFDPDREHCYRVALAADGALQVYIDEPGAPSDTYLTYLITEVLAGPAPPVRSVLETP